MFPSKSQLPQAYITNNCTHKTGSAPLRNQVMFRCSKPRHISALFCIQAIISSVCLCVSVCLSVCLCLCLCVSVCGDEAVQSLLRASFFAEKLAISFLFDTCALGLAKLEATKKSISSLALPVACTVMDMVMACCRCRTCSTRKGWTFQVAPQNCHSISILDMDGSGPPCQVVYQFADHLHFVDDLVCPWSACGQSPILPRHHEPSNGRFTSHQGISDCSYGWVCCWSSLGKAGYQNVLDLTPVLPVL